MGRVDSVIAAARTDSGVRFITSSADSAPVLPSAPSFISCSALLIRSYRYSCSGRLFRLEMYMRAVK